MLALAGSSSCGSDDPEDASESVTSDEATSSEGGSTISSSETDLVSESGIETSDEGLRWSLPISDWPAGLLSVSGTAADDVWVAGAKDEAGPTILHWDGAAWERLEAPVEHSLWWVHALSAEEVFFGGEQGTVLRWSAQGFERMETPALARQTVFGVWARAADDVYAVGGIGMRGGFVWHFDGETWREMALPQDLPQLHHGDRPALFKVWGDDESLWVVGGLGVVLRSRGGGPLQQVPMEDADTLFTVAGSSSGRVAAVGGGVEAWVQELAPSAVSARIPETPLLQGITFGLRDEIWASGAFGTVLREVDGELVRVPLGLEVPGESLHAIWVDPEGGVWSVGGNVISAALDRGVLLHGAAPGATSPPTLDPPPPVEPEPVCTTPAPDLERWSVARIWNEETLGAIRRALPEPTVHARNLYHVSLALHDAWAAWEPEREGLIHVGEVGAGGASDRRVAMSYAALRLLEHRYRDCTGGEASMRCFERTATLLGLDPEDRRVEGDDAIAIGNRIGNTIIDAFADDGSNEAIDYVDPDYRFRNPALRVDDPGIEVEDVNDWQPLDLAIAITQNGIPEESGPQEYIGPHWGNVVPFAIERPAPDAPYFDAGPRPVVEDDEMGEWVLQVIRQTAWLDIEDGETMDISPGAYGNNPLGEDTGTGHLINPVTGLPYEPQIVLRGDFGRVLAEFWADGPNSETPPGHWNVMAHTAFDHPDFDLRWEGEGPTIHRLDWDVKAFVVLNGALHDAAIVAWEVKRDYYSARPVSLIRWMGARGQSSDPQLDAYDPLGLPLAEGLVELITPESAAPGERHAHLAAHVGEIAVWSWPGDPGDPERARSAFRWIRVADWMPYQPRTFVTPAFPGFVSGHSTFSRTAADVLTLLTGDAFVPGGLGEFVARQNEYLEFELGPSTDVRLQWATWKDAADQAGQSRIWGGIHVVPDDWVGRELGAEIALRAGDWARPWLRGEPVRPLPTGSDDTDIPSDPSSTSSDAFPAPIGDPPDGDPELRPGTGREGFVSLFHGDAVRWEAGIQGGHHIWVSARADAALLDALDPEELSETRTNYTIQRQDGELLASISRRGGWRRTDDAWEHYGNFSILRPGLRPNRLDDEPLLLEVELLMPDDEVLRASVWVRSACCD